MTVGQAFQEVNFNLVANFFLTTFPTNMLKFPVFEADWGKLHGTSTRPAFAAARF